MKTFFMLFLFLSLGVSFAEEFVLCGVVIKSEKSIKEKDKGKLERFLTNAPLIAQAFVKKHKELQLNGKMPSKIVFYTKRICDEDGFGGFVPRWGYCKGDEIYIEHCGGWETTLFHEMCHCLLGHTETGHSTGKVKSKHGDWVCDYFEDFCGKFWK